MTRSRKTWRSWRCSEPATDDARGATTADLLQRNDCNAGDNVEPTIGSGPLTRTSTLKSILLERDKLLPCSKQNNGMQQTGKPA